MKRMKLIMTISLVILFAASDAQIKDKDAMVKKIFTVLQQKDKEGFVRLFPDAATSKIFLVKILGEESSAERDELLASLTDSSMQSEFRETFSQVIKQGEERGIDWAQTKLISYLADSSTEEHTKMPKLNGKIYFNAGKKEYFMVYDEVIWFEGLGWYGVDIGRIDEKSKEYKPDESVRSLDVDSAMLMMTDTTMMMPDTARKVIIEEKQEVKPKTPKEKNKPVKSKSQTAALKPD